MGQTVPIDSVQEYRVVTNNFAAQYGRASGGVVNVITKSGTNAFHGSAWEFNRLSAYTSNTYDNNANGTPKGTYTRNQFGFAVGGPIVKDKLFFFESTEWLRTRSSANSIALVPDPAFLAAASPNTRAFFSAYGQNQPVANRGVITQAQILQGGSGFGPAFSALAPSTSVFDKVSYTSPTDAGGGAPTNQYYLNGRVDYNFTDKTQTYVRYALQKLTNTNGFDSSSPYSQFNVGDDATNNSVLWNISHVFNAHLLTNTKLSYTRFNLNQTFDTALQGAPSLYLFPGATILGTPTIFPGFFATNPDGLTNGLPFGGPENTIQWNQDVDYSHGTHELQFGTQVLYLQDNQAAGLFAQADEQLGTDQASSLEGFLNGTSERFAGAVYPQGKLPCTENYLTGALEQTPDCSVTLPATQPSFARSNRFHDWAAYGQDSWKATQRLTLNYGIRYEYYGVQHNNNQNLDSNFYYGSGSGIAEEVRNGQVLTVPNSPNQRLWNPSYGTVAPRVGFAYDLTGDGKTSVRGGFGISYERNFGNTTFNVIENPPNYAVVEISNTPVTVSSAGPLASGSGSVALPPTELRHVDQNIKTAQTQFWSAALERQIVPNTVLSLQYSAARGIHLYDIKNFNDLGAGNVELGDPFRSSGEASAVFHYSRPNNQYTSINTRGSNGDSYYEALNISLQSTNLLHTGLNITANYTYSHNIDDISSTFSESNSASNGVGNLGYLDPHNPGLDRGNSDIDLRERFVLAPIWNTPWFAGQRGWKERTLGGYHVSGIYQVRSGTPFTISDSSNSLNASFGQGIPRYAPAAGSAQKLTKSAISSNFNGQPNDFLLANLPAALNYSNPAFGGISDFGPFPAAMTGRNYFTGPGAWNLDMAVSKVIPLKNNVALELRAEGFNIFNHSNLYENGVQNDVAQYGYGVAIPIQARKGGVSSSSAGDERRFGQFAAKVSF